MQYGYIIKITGHNFYNEAQLASNLTGYSIGTRLESDLRFRKELFFEEFELQFRAKEDGWSVTCSDNVFLDFGDVRKLSTKNLKHGDSFAVKYQDSGTELFRIEFLFDFDNENKDYSRVVNIRNADRIRIGTESNSNLLLSGDYLNKGSFELYKKPDQTYLVSIRSKGYGVYHNGQSAVNGTVVKDGDFLSLSDFSFYLKDGNIYTSQAVAVSGLDYYDLDQPDSYPKFNRNTRLKSKINEEAIEVLDPPNPPQKPKGNILMQLFPALAMIVMIIVVRGFMGNSSNFSFIIFSVCSMTIGIITSIVSIVQERKKYKLETANRIEKYNEYINKKRKQITGYRADELTRLNGIYITPDEEFENISNFSGDIFDKVTEDEDFLEVRLGTGTVEARRKIAFKKKEKFDSEDELAVLPEQVYNDYKNIEHAPITLDLKTNNVVGVIGQQDESYWFVKKVVLDIIARHYYRDVQLFFLINEADAEKYSKWLKWLPHIVDEKTKTRNIVYNANSKASVFERLYVEFGKRLTEKHPAELHYVIFVLDDWGIKTHPVAQFIPFANECNASFFFFDNKKSNLPLWCSKIITLEMNGTGTMVSSDDKDTIVKFTFEGVEDGKLISAAKALSPVFCEEISLENALTKNITLFEMLNILGVEDINLNNNWSNSTINKTMAAPLGVKTKNEIVYLDLHEKAHGPHGLVAGTTGSGKSELLQTYILSMASLYHPYEVGFVIIDFKGGGMANQFASLPHLIGTITNIDGKEINRSLMSIKAELEKRQRLFAEYNVNNINSYIKLFKSGETEVAIPHLIIIVDEFAELKTEQPEFMKELISTARIGRSLGVHLILATQKPAGQVNEQIWSNSKFKICLKVQTKEDSNEVLKSPLAAEIKEPGRAYLQVGNNEIFDLFQSAYSGAPARVEDATSEREFVISEVDLQGKRHIVFRKVSEKHNTTTVSQLDAIVTYIHEYCKKNSIQHLSSICLPPLEDTIEYANVGRSDNISLMVPIGVYDDPEHQAQNLAWLNLSAGNTVIVGSSQYGKTNLLQLIVRSLCENYSPDEVNLYVLDFGSMALRTFDNLNHVGGVVIASEDERVKHLFRLLSKEMAVRKEKFAQLGITSFTSYVEAGYRDLPHIVLMLDNFIAFRELYSDYEDDMLLLCREGPALGISIIVTSLQSNGISYKYLSNFLNRVALYCNSRDEYSYLFDRCRMEPNMVPGRGLVQIEKQVFEAQTYLAFSGEREIDRVEEIQKFVGETNRKNIGKKAKSIPSIPKLLDVSYIEANAPDLPPYQVPVGLDYETIECQIIDLLRVMTLGISGREKSGKTNLLKLILDYCQNTVFDYPTKAYLIDDYNRQLHQFAAYGFVEKYTVDVGAFEDILIEIEDDLKERKSIVQKEGPESLASKPLIICVVENQSAFENGTLSKQVEDSFKRILSSYKQLKVLFIFSNIPNVNITYNAPEMLKQVKDFNMLYFLDDLTNAKMVDLNASVIRYYKKPIEVGDAYQLLSDGTISKIRTVKAEERGTT